MKKSFPLILILIIGSAFRFIGIYPGYPPHPDEAGYGSALTMILNKNLDPGRYDYPSAVALTQYLIFRLVFIPFGWLKFFLTNTGLFLDGLLKLPLSQVDYDRVFQLTILGPQQINTMYWGRYVTAAFGVGVIIISYLLAKKVFGKSVALISAFLIAVNFRQVLNSHIGLQDIYNAFFLNLTIYFLYKIQERDGRWNYFFAGFFNALFFSVKFQIFGFIAIFVAHVMAVWKKYRSPISNIRSLIFSSNLFIAVLTSIVFIVFLNSYHLINFDFFWKTQIYISSKYGVGANSLSIYPISYLYHIGIGKVISALALLGLIVSLIKYFKTSLIINLVVFLSMLTFLYLTRGGFYTRNFIAVTPLLLILAAVFIDNSFRVLFKTIKNRWLYTGLMMVFVIVISAGNIMSSYLVVSEYSKPWNQKVLADWVAKNIPKNARVSAHSNTPLPVPGVTRFKYEPDEVFSIDEFAVDKAEFAIANFSWATNSFYWWMGGEPRIFIKHYWNKPVEILEYMYSAMALRELEQFAIYAVTNPWQAPDVDFVVAKIPKYKVSDKKLAVNFSFDKGTDGWVKQGKFWVKEDNMDWEKGALVVKEEPASFPSLRWESPPIEVSSWRGFEIVSRMKSESDKKNLKTGYVFVSFYESEEDANESVNRVGVRISSRNSENDRWVEKGLVGQIPNQAKYMTVGFYNYDPARSKVELDRLTISEAEVAADYDGFDVGHLKIDQNNLFPNSHGNL